MEIHAFPVIDIVGGTIRYTESKAILEIQTKSSTSYFALSNCAIKKLGRIGWWMHISSSSFRTIPMPSPSQERMILFYLCTTDDDPFEEYLSKIEDGNVVSWNLEGPYFDMFAVLRLPKGRPCILALGGTPTLRPSRGHRGEDIL